MFNCDRFTTGFLLSQWDQVNMIFYIVIPFLVMTIFNFLLIINIRNSRESSKSAAKKRNLTLTLFLLCFLFIAMTAPGTLLYGYFYDSVLASLSLSTAFLIDDVSYLNHSMLFFTCFISNKKFRRTVILMFRCHFKSN